jgi:hypothetical protein
VKGAVRREPLGDSHDLAAESLELELDSVILGRSSDRMSSSCVPCPTILSCFDIYTWGTR